MHRHGTHTVYSLFAIITYLRGGIHTTSLPTAVGWIMHDGKCFSSQEDLGLYSQVGHIEGESWLWWTAYNCQGSLRMWSLMMNFQCFWISRTSSNTVMQVFFLPFLYPPMEIIYTASKKTTGHSFITVRDVFMKEFFPAELLKRPSSSISLGYDLAVFVRKTSSACTRVIAAVCLWSHGFGIMRGLIFSDADLTPDLPVLTVAGYIYQRPALRGRALSARLENHYTISISSGAQLKALIFIYEMEAGLASYINSTGHHLDTPSAG